MAFTINMNNLIAMQSRFTLAQPGLARVVQQGANAAGDAAVQELHDKAPFDPALNNGVIPGEEEHLNESFSAENTASTSLTSLVEVKTSEPIKFQYVTQGTGTPILPVVRKALWWPDALNPRASVRGQEANPFQEPIGTDIQDRGEEFYGPYIEAWLARLEP